MYVSATPAYGPTPAQQPVGRALGQILSIPQIQIQIRTPAGANHNVRLGSAASRDAVRTIPASGRSLHKISCKQGRYCRIRPSTDRDQDPFRHAAFNLVSTNETEGLLLSSLKSGRCHIMHCEYCKLCYEFGIDAFAYQEKLVPGGVASEHWDPYFHWIMNEQIPHLGGTGLYQASRKLGSCWIINCEYCQLRTTRKTRSRSKMRCGDKISTMHCETVERPNKWPQFPPEACPRWCRKASRHVAVATRCRHCTDMISLLEGQFGRDTRPAHLTPAQERHNVTLLRRIIFALSPLARDREAARKFPGDELLRKSQVLVSEIDLSFPARVRFADDDSRRPRSPRKPGCDLLRAPSPYPAGMAEGPARTPSPYPGMSPPERRTSRRRACHAADSEPLLPATTNPRTSAEPKMRAKAREGGITFSSQRYSSSCPNNNLAPPLSGSMASDRSGTSDRLLSSARAEGGLEHVDRNNNFFNKPKPQAMSRTGYYRQRTASTTPSSFLEATTPAVAAEPLGSPRSPVGSQQQHWASSMAAWDQQDYDNSHGHRAEDATTPAALGDSCPPAPFTPRGKPRKSSNDSVASADSSSSVADSTITSVSTPLQPPSQSTRPPSKSPPRARRTSWWQGVRIFMGLDRDPNTCAFCGFYITSCSCVYLDEETGQMVKASPVLE